MAKMRTGQVVKFAAPTTPDEAAERFRVLEDRGDRVLVEFICDLAIAPTYVYPVADLREVTGCTLGPDPRVVEFLSDIGRRGGSSRSARKKRAVVKNLRKANAAKRKAAKKRGGAK
jgi:hypothetical protein